MAVLLRANVILWHLLILSVSAKEDAIIFASELHQDMCVSSTTLNDSNRCCGFCNNDQDCDLYGSCCLSKHGSFAEGKDSLESTRYACVLPQYLTSEEDTLYITAADVEPVWMTSKCDPWFRGLLEYDTIKQLCENPGSVDSIQSLVPVAYKSHVFRNKYCAFCNGVNVLNTDNFKMEIQCADTFTVIYNNFLSTIREKKCNVFYRASEFTPVVNCSIPGYRINRCNVTGLWSVFDATVKQACEAFIDPFNSTFQNYFCYMCNSGEIMPRDSWYCPAPFHKLPDTPPVYSVLLDVDVLTNVGTENLVCDTTTQFKDYKMKLCRNISCHFGRIFDLKACTLEYDFEPLHPCMLTYIKLTPVLGTNVLGQRLTTRRYMEDVWHTLIHYTKVILVKLEMFAKSEWNDSTSFIDYFVVRVTFLTQDNLSDWKDSQTEDILMNIISRIHHKVLISGYYYDEFYCELALYDYVSEESNQIKIKGPSSKNSPADTLVLFQEKTYQAKAFCKDSYIPPLQKLHVCAFITLNVNDLSIGRALGTPSLENILVNNTYSAFDYEIQGENARLCLADFITLYDTLSAPTHGNEGSNTRAICKIIYILLLLAQLTLLIN